MMRFIINNWKDLPASRAKFAEEVNALRVSEEDKKMFLAIDMPNVRPGSFVGAVNKYRALLAVKMVAAEPNQLSHQYFEVMASLLCGFGFAACLSKSVALAQIRADLPGAVSPHSCHQARAARTFATYSAGRLLLKADHENLALSLSLMRSRWQEGDILIITMYKTDWVRARHGWCL